MPRTLKPPAVPVPPPVYSLGSSMPLAELDRASSGTALAQLASHSQTTHTPFYHPLNGGGGVVSSARSSMLRSSVSSAAHARQGSIVPESPTSAQPPPSFFVAGSPSDHRPQKVAQLQHCSPSAHTASGAEASALMSSPAAVPAPFASHAFQPQLPGVFFGAPHMAAGPLAAAVPAAVQRHHRVASVHHGSPITAMTPAGADEKAMIVAERFRTRMCRHVEAGGACPYTNHCMFAHTSEQLRTVDANLEDNITSEDAVRDFQHRELVHARKARRVARRRAKLQLARAAKAREAGTDPLKGGSDHDDVSDHGEHDDDHTTSDHSDHDVVEPAAIAKAVALVEAPTLKKKGASPTEPQPKAAMAAHPHHQDPQRAVVAKTVSPTEAAVAQHHRPRVSTTPRQGGVAHPPPPAYSASSAATSPTNGTVRNASFVVNAAAPCCNCQCHCHALHPLPPAPAVKVGSPVSSSSALIHHAPPPRAAPPATQQHHHQQQHQPQVHRPVAPAAAEGSAAHQYGFASDYMAQLLQAQAGQEYDDEEEADEGEWEEEQQPVQPAYYQGPQAQYAAGHSPVPVAPHVAFVQPHHHQPQFSGHYTAQPQQPVMSRSHSHQNLVGQSHSHHWSPENGLGLGATAATMQQQQQLQYGAEFQQPTQPVVPSPTHGSAGGARGVVMVSVGSKYPQPYAPSPPASAYAPTPKATTAGTPTAAGGETASAHAAGSNPNYYPMCQVQSQQQLNHQLHDMMRYQQQQYHQHHQRQPSGQQQQQLGHARSLSQVCPSNPLSPDTPTARSVASHPHSHAAGHSHQQAVYDAARHIVLVETPVNGPDGVVRGSRTSWRHEPYDLLMPQHH